MIQREINNTNFNKLTLFSFFFFFGVGSFSEHLDQAPSRGDGVESLDSSCKPSSDTAAFLTAPKPETTEKQFAVSKVPKSVSTSALSLMIPGGECAVCVCERICWNIFTFVK